MSSPLPNALLVQRLDTLLGVSLAKYTNFARTDTHFEALLAPGKTTPVDDQTPQRQAADQTDAAVKNDRRLRQSRSTDTLISSNKQRPTQQVDSFPSSPTTLGATARLVLSLLQSYPLTPSLVLRSSMAEASTLAQLGTALSPSSSATATPSTDPSSTDIASRTTPSAAPAAVNTATSNTAPSNTAPSNTATSNTASGAATSNPLNTTIQLGQAQTPSGSTASATVGVWPSASQPAITQLAQTLAHQVQTSGMFYESTLARVAFQGASAQLLQQHPQVLFHSVTTADTQTTAANTTASQTPQAQDRTDSSSHAGTRLSVSTLATEQALLVRQQLEVLATQQWQAQTQAWPGVPVLWTIERMASEHPASEQNPHEDSHSSADDNDTPLWQTRLTLQLPQIGTVEACLQFKGEHCRLSLYSPQSADILRQHAPALQAQFAGSSVSLSSLDIYDHLAAMPQQAASTEEGAPP